MRQSNLHISIRDCSNENSYPVESCCDLLHVSRGTYYRWLSGKKPNRQVKTSVLLRLRSRFIQTAQTRVRRIRDELDRYHNIRINDKRMLRICRTKDIKSTTNYANNGCTRQAKNLQYVAENLLSRDFHAPSPMENG